MLCHISCIIAVVFTISMFYMMYASPYKKNTLMGLLTDQQKIRYLNIINERRQISKQGYCLGLILSVILLLFYKLFLNKRLTSGFILCTVAATAFLTQYFYYILSRKSDWMVLHLYTKDQRREWLKIYRKMQFNYHVGFVLGIIGITFGANTVIPFMCK